MPTEKQYMDIIRIQSEIAKMGLDLSGIMSMFVVEAAQLMGIDGAAIELIEGDSLVYNAGHGLAAGQVGLRVNLATSLSGACLQQNQALICQDSQVDNRVDRAACQRVGLRSMVVHPLSHQGKPVGVLKLISSEVGRFAHGDTSLISLLTETLSAAMHYAVQYDTEHLFHAATHDGLTGLANRALFIDRLVNSLQVGARSNHPTGVLMVDMNGLKGINDTYGHLAGDASLQEVSKRLAQCSRSTDTVARLGGDEFALVLTPMGDLSDMDMFVNRIHAELADPLSFENTSLTLSASIGAAISPHDGNDFRDLIALADQRMYQQKRQHHALA